MRKEHWLSWSPVLTVGLVMALSGCEGNAQPQEPPVAAPAAGEPARAAAPAPRKLSVKEQIAFGRVDLAERLGIEAEAVALSGATPVNWRSGALGCPEPGMNYTQALVPGTWIIFKVDETLYRYHAALFSEPFYCPDDRAEPPAAGAEKLPARSSKPA